MRTLLPAALVAVGVVGQVPGQQQAVPVRPGVMLEQLAWPEAETRLTPDAVVVLPLGAGAVEHGPHLTLGSDLTMARYLASRIADATPVVVAPALTYHANPGFTEYPGSTSISLESTRAVTTDVVRSLARFGPRRFYVLNLGHAMAGTLQRAAEDLGADGVLMGFTQIEQAMEPVAAKLRQQQGGAHADEIETSMMLYIEPGAVNMARAVKDGGPWRGRLTRQRGAGGTYSASGVWGDPTLATRAKGQQLVEHLVSSVLRDIDALRSAPLAARAASRTTTGASRPAAVPSRTAGGCTDGDERAIRRLGDAFTTHWRNGDAERLGGLWDVGGDIFHPDGTLERTRQAIVSNRLALFRRAEYRQSKHPVSLVVIRCVGADVAVADGKWELDGVTDTAGKPVPTFTGQVTLVVTRGGDAGWQIAAYRYTVNTPAAQPTTLQRPGWPGR